MGHGAHQPLLHHRAHGNVYSLASLMRRAVVEPDAKDGPGLKKCLTAIDLIAYGVGSTVGAGIFVTVGEVASGHAGPAVLISFLSAAFACLISAFCYAEFAARIPISGSAYSFSYVALGEFVGWFIGWNLTLEYSISAGAVARGWGSYMGFLFQLFNITLPTWLTDESPFGPPLDNWISFSPLSIVIVIICTIILIMGVKDSAKFNLVVTIMNVTTITFVIVLGAFHVKIDNWSNFFPFGVQGAFAGAGIVFFSYIGFDSVTTLAGEVARPGRDLPLGIVGTLSIATVLYVGISLVLTGMVNYKEINAVSPLSSAFDQIGLRWAAIVVSFGGVTALVAGVLCSLLGQPRIYYQMALDGLLPPKFAQVNNRQVPVFGTLITAATAGLLAVSFDLAALTAMISIGTLLAFTVVCAGIIVTRCRHPDKDIRDTSWRRYSSVSVMLLVYFLASAGFSAGIKYKLEWWGLIILGSPLVILTIYFMVLPQPNIPTTFRCPLVPLLPLLGMLVNTFLIVQLNIDSIYRVIGWTAIGMLIYFGYGIRHSKLNFVPPSDDSLNASDGGYKKFLHAEFTN
eukprot:Phypoly_transcript_06362.p1 GENE.Phypoly_transcript_06362~~Phypoly_transcript_06362.p1  ORF type:complete len:570 (+),score=72.50 Phypoly_transcript_06362:83-1792(+)